MFYILTPVNLLSLNPVFAMPWVWYAGYVCQKKENLAINIQNVTQGRPSIITRTTSYVKTSLWQLRIHGH